MSSVPAPGELFRAYGQRAKKRFGQHFLTDPQILDSIVDLADVDRSTRVIEIGPGCGTLTSTLLARGAEVVAVELDRDAASFLRAELLPASESLTIVEADALEVDFEELADDREACVVANLPYNVATPILFRLLESSAELAPLVLMFQREVAERLVASPGSKKYGALTVRAAMWAEARVALRLKPGAFTPPPAVESAVVVLEPRAVPELADGVVRRHFDRVVRAAFSQRRKTVRNSLGSMWETPVVERALDEAGIDPRTRAERLDFADYLRLAAALPSERNGDE